MKHPGFLVLACFGLLLGSNLAAGTLDATVAERIDTLFKSQVEAQAPGRAVTIVRDGELLLSSGYGLAQLEYGIPVTGKTVFHVASLSKQFTAFAVLLLVDEGRIDLDADVRTYVPWSPKFEYPITIRQLIHHVSGLQNIFAMMKLAGWAEGDVMRDADLRWLLRNQTSLDFKPGQQYQYSNLGYFLLSKVVAHVSGVSFAEYLRAHIFAPLGMTNTHVHDDPRALVPNRAYSYQLAPGGKYERALFNAAAVGASGVQTTAEDLALWLDNFRTGKVGGTALIERMQQTGTLNDGTALQYAFGIEVMEFAATKILTHGGLDAGFRSHLAWIPSLNTGIVVLSNSAEAVPANDVTSIFLTLAMPESQPDSQAQSQTAAPTPTAPDTRFIAGDYLNSIGMPFSIKPTGVMVFKEREWPLTQVSATDYLSVPANVQLHFGDDRVGFNYVGFPLEARLRDEIAMPVRGELDEFAGLYFAADIQTYYHLLPAKDGHLLLRHGKLGEVALTRFSPDLFVGEPVSQLRFQRNEQGELTGFSIPIDRIGPGVRFAKVR